MPPVHTDHHVVEHHDVHFGSPTGPLRASVFATVTEEKSQIESLVQDAAPDSLAQTTHEAIQSNPRIQLDMKLWRRIREYDQKSVELPFIPVLSKKQKHDHLKKTTIGKPYKTRSRGDTSLTDQ